MYKIAILGCENSHADSFLKTIRDEKLEDIQVVGVYSSFPGEAEDLHETFGVPVADSYDAFVGKIDGLVITARHGDNHYKYAKPYLKSGIPMFIDKPITVTEADAREFMAELKKYQVPVSGGSILKHSGTVQELKALVASGEHGQPLGGFLRAPIDIESEHGGFYFYAQHLVQSMCEIFGYYPKSVLACRNGDQITCTVRYDNYDVACMFMNHSYVYYAAVNFSKSIQGQILSIDGTSSREFHDFYELLKGNPQKQSYEDLFAPVYIMNAMDRALQSGKEEPVNWM